MATTDERFPNRPRFKTIDWTGLVRKLDPKWNEPEVEYVFSNGRKFVRLPEDQYRDTQ